MSPPRAVWVVGIIGLFIAVGLCLRMLIPRDLDPTIFVTFGEHDESIQRSYPGRVLGNPMGADGSGHDGKWFFAQANDPWYLHPLRHAVVLDRPLYRAQRMVYPTIASGFGILPPEAIVWSMFVTKVLALTVGAMLLARLSILWGVSPWLGLWLPLNPGMMFELQFGGSGILAYVFCLGGVHSLLRMRSRSAVALFAAACLSRETMILFCIGIVVLWWRDKGTVPWGLVLVPLLAMSAWNAYLRIRLAQVPGTGEYVNTFGPPFAGILKAFSIWVTDPLHLTINLVFLALLVVFVPLALRSRQMLAWGALPLVAIAPLFSVNVWLGFHNSSRALAAVFTAFPILVAMNRKAAALGLSPPGVVRFSEDDPAGRTSDLTERGQA